MSDMWAAGDRIADLYEVRDVHQSGGMGVVHRVRHLGWDVDLAVKSPRPEVFRTAADRERFVQEAQTWVALGLHPHVCGCHYVRTIGGVPRVFAEYVEGGSLRDRIRDRRLYAGTEAEALARVLDLAVQIGWGLAHAHALGVVHQDVKPANVLVDGAGTAKVTDFGLARAGRGGGPAAGGTGGGTGGGGTILVTVGGMTPAYASPEQFAGGPVGRRSDLWSWAVTVLEMFTGRIAWPSGAAAGAALAGLTREGGASGLAVPMPAAVAALLAECLREDPARRPAAIGEVAERLARVYEREAGRGYGRAVPAGADLRADELNNRALSLLDLGRTEEAAAAFDEARAADPRHVESAFNRWLTRWRDGRIRDDELVGRLEDLAAGAPDPWRVRALIGQVHLERGDPASALPLLDEAARRAPGDGPLQAALRRARRAPSSPEPRELGETPGRARFVGLGSDARTACSGGADGRVMTWRPAAEGPAAGRHALSCSGAIESVALSADGRFVACGNDLGGIQVAARHGDGGHRYLRSLYADRGGVPALGFSSDGSLLASGDTEEALRIWDVDDGRCLRTFEGHLGEVTAVAFGAGDRRLVSGGGGGEVRIWDLPSGVCLRTLQAPRGTDVGAVWLSADGRTALCATGGTTLTVWNVDTGAVVRTLTAAEGDMASVGVSADGRTAVTGGSPGRGFRVWDLASGRCLHTCADAWYRGGPLALSADGRTALVGDGGAMMWLWDVPRPGTPCALQPSRPRGHREIASLDARARELLDGAARAMREERYPAAQAALTEVRGVEGWERAPEALAAWAELIPRARRGGVRTAWHAATLEEEAERVAFHSVALTPDGAHALVGRDDGEVWVLEAVSGRRVHTLRGHTAYVYAIRLSADGELAFTGSADRTVRVWYLPTGACLKVLEGHTGSVMAVGPNADGSLVASGGSDQTVRVWDARTGQCLRVLEEHAGRVVHAELSMDGRVLLSVALSRAGDGDGDGESGGREHAVRVWDVGRANTIRTLQVDEGFVTAAALSADGRTALVASPEHAINVWDVPSDRLVRTLEGHTGAIRSLQVTADGRTAVSASHDGTVRLWDAGTGGGLLVLESDGRAMDKVALSADGRYALTADLRYTPSGSEGEILLWEFDWELEAKDAADWDEAARPLLEAFLVLHTPRAAWMPRSAGFSGRLGSALTSRRQSAPSWTALDVQDLMRILGHAGHGELRENGVRDELRRMARDWRVPQGG